jgi:hypothetical protein
LTSQYSDHSIGRRWKQMFVLAEEKNRAFPPGGFVSGSDDRHRGFVTGLSSGERLLLLLRDELYEGDWENVLSDLRDRLENRPYVFRLSSKIEADVVAIEKLSNYEKENRINLRDFLDGFSH